MFISSLSRICRCSGINADRKEHCARDSRETKPSWEGQGVVSCCGLQFKRARLRDGWVTDAKAMGTAFAETLGPRHDGGVVQPDCL